MALQMGFDFKGLRIADGYVRAAVVGASKNELCACVTFHANSSSEELFSEMHTVAHDLNGPNALAQVYLGIKATDRFLGAVDV